MAAGAHLSGLHQEGPAAEGCPSQRIPELLLVASTLSEPAAQHRAIGEGACWLGCLRDGAGKPPLCVDAAECSTGCHRANASQSWTFRLCLHPYLNNRNCERL